LPGLETNYQSSTFVIKIPLVRVEVRLLVAKSGLVERLLPPRGLPLRNLLSIHGSMSRVMPYQYSKRGFQLLSPGTAAARTRGASPWFAVSNTSYEYPVVSDTFMILPDFDNDYFQLAKVCGTPSRAVLACGSGRLDAIA
jgi:hypothetical protein